MSESAGIDSFFGASDAEALFRRLVRVIEDVETGASRREAAERYGISPSVVVIWVQRFEETGAISFAGGRADASYPLPWPMH